MGFEETIRGFSERIAKLKDTIATEEATKTSLIMPFFQALGYDIFNPAEFNPEFVADVGTKKNEKVDYAIIIDGEVQILVEAKAISEKLDKHGGQLLRYYNCSKAKFGILTNGVIYKFYSDIEKANVMDETPFWTLDLSTPLKPADIAKLSCFCKANFDVGKISESAIELKCYDKVKQAIKNEFAEPSDAFVKTILAQVHDGSKTASVIERYRPIIKQVLANYINERINSRLQNAQMNEDKTEENADEDDGILTTDEEMELYYAVRGILGETVAPDRITYKDTISYFNILLDGKISNRICRAYLRGASGTICIPEHDKSETKYPIETISDIYRMKIALIARVKDIIGETTQPTIATVEEKIPIVCPNCHKEYHVGKNTIGKSVKCKCGTVFKVEA